MKSCGTDAGRSGSTLLEVMVSLVILGILTAAVYSGLNNGNVATAVAAQHVSAFGLCKERLEQMRGAAFDDISTENFPTETVEITHRGGMDGKPIYGILSSTIRDLAKPARKKVDIRLRWTCAGKQMEERVVGEIVDRDALSSDMEIVNGWLCLHPNSKWPKRFYLKKTDGGVINKKTLRNPSFTGWYGYAKFVKVWPKGKGVQTTINYNFQPYPISNAKQWDFRNSQRKIFVYLVKSSSNNKWYMYLSGIETVITSR